MKHSGFRKSYIAILALAFMALILYLHYNQVPPFDLAITQRLQAAGDTPFCEAALARLAWHVSFPGRTAVAAIIVVFVSSIFWLYQYKREAIFTILVTAASGINWLVKMIVNRHRPSEELVQVLDRQKDASFPSGHTVFYTVFFGFLIAAMLKNKKIPAWIRGPLIIISIFFIVSVPFSRIYLGAHWASDVLGGYLLGGACLMILLRYYHKSL